MRFLPLALALVVGMSVACHPGPVVGTSPKASVGGTIAGIVTTADSAIAVPGRKVSAIDATSGAHFESTTAANGGYTIKVPEGTYRIEIELRPGESLAKRPEQTHINNGDLDPHRDFVVTAAPRQ
jgi:Carboxypeptidase regulatory-like domain